jgi:alginate O-acetyltransferase complex protein AlgI
VVHGSSPVLPIILPLGISFFVFEFIHYLVDVYKGSPAVKNPIRFFLFAAFFPAQIAGPIKRYQDFDNQVLSQKRFDTGMFRAGLYLILEGMFKKVVLGDNLAQLVQPGFASPAQMGTLDAWICVAAFTLQIYYDFSGYTDIGRGSAMLLGFQLPENFNMPYIARNMADF